MGHVCVVVVVVVSFFVFIEPYSYTRNDFLLLSTVGNKHLIMKGFEFVYVQAGLQMKTGTCANSCIFVQDK